MSNIIENYIETVRIGINNILPDELVGIYIHGSYAQGTFKWERSDIDMIVLINSSLSVKQKEDLLNLFITLKDKGPKKEIEISFLNIHKLFEESHPYSYEFHYSPYWYKHFEENKWQVTTNKEKIDPDLASHIMNLKSQGIVVSGPEIKDVFPFITVQEFIDSLNYDELDAPLNNVDTIMNLCRSYFYHENGELISKEEGLRLMKNNNSDFNKFLNLVNELYNNNQILIPDKYFQEAKRFENFIKYLKQE
ncbi:nucleotidyltransferase domain-containing protein [Macrococcus animalis]|uniref:nucleotidyltransferase domain-containing protein n=1 Tax=Macrococcus animalis TaxID=3395467 RepID=UPI0039BE3C46